MTKLVVGYSGANQSLRRLFVLLALAFLIGVFQFSLLAHNAFAQGGGADSGVAANPTPNSSGSPDDRGTLPNYPIITTPGTSGNAGTGLDNQYQGPPTAEESAAAKESAKNPPIEVGSTPDGVLGFIHAYVFTGIGWLVGQAGNAFDYAIREYIIKFGYNYLNSNIGVAIDALWSTVRDLFNLTFIFGLVYIGFKMILDSSDSSARKMLISLIGAALLVNFSLFITKFVVDFSNIAAFQIYKAFQTSGAELSIATGFMTLMGVQSMLDVKYTVGGSFAYVFGMLIVFAVLAYVFLAGAIMIIIRFVVLNIYMVFSPMMFLGWVFPAMQGHSTKYWKGFLSQAFFAPAFLFMLYLSYQVAASFNFTQKDFGHLFNPNGSSVMDAPGLIPFFAMVIVFLVASMVVAKNMGATGSSMAVSVGNKLRGSAQGMFYRNTGGRLSKGALNLMDKTGMSNLPGTRALRSGLKSSYEYGAGGTGLAKTRSDIKSEKADITENRSRMVKESKREKLATVITTGTADELERAAAGVSSSDLENMSQAERLALAPYLTDSTVEDFGKTEKVDAGKISEFKKTRAEFIKNSIRSNGEVLTSEFSKLTIAQLEAVGEEFIMANAEHLTQDQMKAIKGSKKFTTGQVRNLDNTRRARFANGDGFTQTYTHHDANNVASTQRRTRSNKEIAAMPTSALTSTTSAKYINSGVLRELEKNPDLTLNDRITIAQNVLQDPTGNQDGRNYLATAKVMNDGNWG